MMTTVLLSIGLVSLILVLCAILDTAILRRRLGIQDSIWQLGLLMVLLAPIFAWLHHCSPKWQIPVIVANSINTDISDSRAIKAPSGNVLPNEVAVDQIPAENVQSVATNTIHAVSPRVDTSNESSSLLSKDQISRYVLPMSISIWVAGAAIAVIQLLRAVYRSAMIRKAGHPITDETWHQTLVNQAQKMNLNAKVVSLCVSDAVSTPLLLGLFKPCLIIPRWLLDSSSPATQQQILTHELTHIQRHDLRRNILLELAVALWWWHPLVHWMKHRTHVLREMICDANTSLLQEPESYAETLLRLAFHSSPYRVLALRFSSRSTSLERRVAWILSQPSTQLIRTLKPATKVTIIATVCLCSLLVTTFRINYVIADEPTPKQNSPQQASSKDGQAEVPPLPTSPSEEVTADTIGKLSPLRSGPNIDGVVLLPDGQPAANVDVYLLELPDGAYTLPTKPHKTQTDESGKFGYQNMPEQVYQIWAESKELITHFELLRGLRIAVQAQAQSIDPIRLKLHPACSFRIKIVEAATGQALAGATIQPHPQDIEREFISDENGDAIIQNLPSIPWKFLIHKPGFAYEQISVGRQPLGDVLELEARLTPGSTISGKLTDQHGAPVANCLIRLNQIGSKSIRDFPKSYSDENGVFKIEDVPLNSKYGLFADIDTHVFTTTEIAVPVDPTVVKADILVPKRDKLISARFQVNDDQGLPIEGAKLTNRGNPSLRTREAITDASGVALLEDILSMQPNSKQPAYVTVAAAGFVPIRVEVAANHTAELAPIEVSLRKGNTVVGKIVKPDGEPAAGLLVYSNSLTDPFADRLRTRTDQDGKFSFEGIGARISLSIDAGPTYKSVSDKQIYVRDGSNEIATITLEYAASIRVKAIDDATDEELKSYNVRLDFSKRIEGDPATNGLSTTMSQDGVDIVRGAKEFRLDGQPIGAAFAVIVSAEGYSTVRLPRVLCVKSDEAPVTEVRMRKPSAADLMKVTVSYTTTQGLLRTHMCDFILRWSLKILLPGRYLLRMHLV